MGESLDDSMQIKSVAIPANSSYKVEWPGRLGRKRGKFQVYVTEGMNLVLLNSWGLSAFQFLVKFGFHNFIRGFRIYDEFNNRRLNT